MNILVWINVNFLGSNIALNASQNETLRMLLLILPIILFLLIGATLLYLDLHLYLRPLPDNLDTAIQQQRQIAKLPGAVVAVIQDNRVVFAKGYGYAHLTQKRPVTPDTIFQIASVSKLVTATTLLRLYEQGKFRLDDDINTYLPFSIRNPKYPDTPITFRMLLAHMSSINDGTSYKSTYTVGKRADSSIALSDYLRSYFTPGGKYYNARSNFTTDPPGTAYTYSNVGFGLVGYLAEQIAKLPFTLLSQQQVFTPLEMDSSTWFHSDVDQTRWAMPYQYKIINRSYAPLGAYSFATYPDGALKTSANDFANFLIPFLNNGKTIYGKPFLQPETVDEMLRVQFPESSGNHGLAWVVKPTNAQHAGGDPGVSSLVVISRSKQRGLVIFTNSGGGDTLGMLRSTFGFRSFVRRVSALLMNLPESPTSDDDLDPEKC